MVSAEAKNSFPNRVKGEIHPSIQKLLNSGVGKNAVRLMVDRIYEHIPTRSFEWEGLENLDALKDPFFNDKKIVLAGTHRSHGDGPVLVAVAQKIDREVVPERFSDIVYTVAGSMEKEQGPLMEALFVQGVKPYFAKVGITPDLVVSDNDVLERGMVRPPDNGELTKQTMQDVGVLNMLHIEGNTKGGKTDPNTGERYGLQSLDSGFRGILRTQMRRNGIPTYLIPVAVEGGDYFFNPNKRGFNKEGLQDIVKALTLGEGTMIGNLDDFISRKLFGDSLRYKPGTVRIGEIVSFQEIYGSYKDFGDNVMRQFAQISSPAYLGDYGRQLLSQK